MTPYSFPHFGECSEHSINRKDKGKRRVIDRKPKKLRTYHKHRDSRFVGWDGEGGTDTTGVHRYKLFGSSDGARISREEGLGWQECLDLLMASEKNAIHVIFAGTYDVIKIFDGAKPALLERLRLGQPVYFGQFRVWWLRGKWLRVHDRQTNETRTLYDCFSFFGGSFVKACREYLSASQLAILDDIERMKGLRSSFTTITDEVELYMSRELDLLVMLMETLRARLAAVDIHPASWHGPGAVAGTILRSKKIKQARGVYDDSFRLLAESAYYGGRFEQFRRGNHNGPTFEYDIRSAYPAAMRHLPDLSQVRWYFSSYRGTVCKTEDYGLYRVRYQHDSGSPKKYDRSIGALPWRNNRGSIYYPTNFVDGWYWGVEIPEWLWPHITEGYEPDGDGLYARPFRFVEEMYYERARLKAEGKPEQLALKLGLNSLYGKLAQSKGARRDKNGWHIPGFHEPVWAGWITAYTRRRLYDAIDPANIIAVETDALFTSAPLALDEGTKLGQWESVKADGILYLQSGVYFLRFGDEWHIKSRGFSPKGHEASKWLEHIKGLPYRDDDGMEMHFVRFITDHRLPSYGQWVPSRHRLSLDRTRSKREHIADMCDVCGRKRKRNADYAVCQHWLSVPKLIPAMSTPYPFPWRNPDLAEYVEIEYEGLDLYYEDESVIA